MKKIITVCLSAVLIACTLCALSGCIAVEKSEAMELIQTAINNALNAKMYYIKVLTINNGQKHSEVVNLMAAHDEDEGWALDADGNPIIGASTAIPANYKLAMTEETFYSATALTADEKFYTECGEATDKDGNNPKNLLRVWDKKKDTELKNTEITTADYIASDDFYAHSLKGRLAELDSIKAEDMDFDIEDGGMLKKIYVYVATFKMSDAYLANYLAVNGRESVLKGKYVVLEIAYDRIQSLTVYQNDGQTLSVDEESYKLSISYLGPKFNIAAY